MQPAWFRKGQGFGALGALGSTVLAIAPAHAAVLSENMTPLMAGAAPVALASGGMAFGALAVYLTVRSRREARTQTDRSNAQLAALRARLDEAQGLLEGMPEITIRFADGQPTPSVFGPLSVVLPAGHNDASVLDFNSWLDASDAESLGDHLHVLRERGEPFDLTLSTAEGRLVRAIGRAVGAAAVLWIRAAFVQPKDNETGSDMAGRLADRTGAEAIFSLIGKPAWVRDPKGQIVYANGAYRGLLKQLGIVAKDGATPEVFQSATLKGHLTALAAADGPVTVERALRTGVEHDLVIFPLADGTAGYLRQREDSTAMGQPISGELSQISGVINALKMPIAIFDARRQLVQANTAYAQLWELDAAWLVPGLKEQTILDRLRTKGLLPAEIDYRAWRGEHLKSYGLTRPRDTLWHLPDGRAINVASVPASASGGVVYVFEDYTAQLALESRFKALTHVQSETINALSEGVAVFGTNGRLALSNPRLSTLWKLPLNELEANPHIDVIGAACAQSMPEDGAIIWRDLKQLIVDLNPTRSDKSGRIRRADGRLIDYAAVRLPDGQTMITFVDVTESASYQRVLQERNDALMNADKLKDAFVQNVSYELRSPLTNIIGFADLLASGTAGELNEKQKSYTDYIRASSTTLGVLIDNILDLANVDAGISELDLREQDVSRLVEQAKAGLAATFSEGSGETPMDLQIEIAPDLPAFIADGTRIVQILYNLLANAARFSEAGSPVRLTISGRGQERVVFTVDDEGVGVPEEIREAIFQRFEGHTIEGRQRGAGLGLAIVRAFVELHGGTISMEQRAPKGTRVVVNLPADASAALATNAAE